MKHSERIQFMSKNILSPPHTYFGKMQREMLDKVASNEVHTEIKKRYKKLLAMFTGQMENGSNLITSKYLRSHLNEINGRNINHGRWSFPSSFNVFEAYLEFYPDILYFHLYPEEEYKLDISSYFDFLTSESNANIDIAMLSFNEDLIYSFDFISPEKLTFRVNEIIEYFINGISIIRHSEELNFIVSVGLKDANYEPHKLNRSGSIVWEGKENILPNSELPEEPIYINDGYQQTLLLFRIDLENKSQEARYLLRDEGNHFTVLTDDLSSFLDDNGNITDQLKNTYNNIKKRLDGYNDLFEISRSLIYVFEYITKYEDSITVERQSTEFRANYKKESYQRDIQGLSTQDRIFFRNINVINVKRRTSFSSVKIKNPYFNIEKNGYWKILEPTQIGLDKDGNNILGKTWVNELLSWVEDFDSEFSSIIEDDSIKFGYIYIMRNASLDRNIFKLGLTTRNPYTRAKELFMTGSPDQFLIAQDWKVKDPVLAEKTIHDELSEYRISDRREFFRAEYKLLVSVIENVVNLINSKNPEKSDEVLL